MTSQSPLPGEVQQARDSMRQYFDDTVHPNDSYSLYCQLVDDLDTLELHISDLTRRLAEAEEEKVRLSNTVELVKHGLNGPWEPGGDVAALAKEAGDALQDIGALRAMGDWSTYRELPLKVEVIQNRAEAALARVRELEADNKQHEQERIEDAGKIWELEAFKARVMAFAAERCICGLVGKACPKGMFYGVPKWSGAGPCENWMPPQAWEVGE